MSNIDHRNDETSLLQTDKTQDEQINHLLQHHVDSPSVPTFAGGEGTFANN